MKRSTLFVFLILILFSACKENRERILQKKWKAKKINNLSQKKAKKYYENLLDTISLSNPMVQDFGGLDSCKKYIEYTLQTEAEMHKQNEENTFLEFKPDGLAEFSSIDGVFKSAWHIEEDEIVLEDEKVTGVANTTRMKIEKLDNDHLNIRWVNMLDTSFIELVPYTD